MNWPGAYRGRLIMSPRTASCPRRPTTSFDIVLEQILDGIAVMKADRGRAEGAVKVVQALELYGTYFNHTGWKPPKH